MTGETMTYRSILVPLDGSALGEQSLPLASAIAARAEAGVQLAHVHVSLVPTYADTVMAYDNVPDDVLKLREQGYLERTVKRLRTGTRVPVTSALLEGPVVRALQDWAASACVDLVVMTTHGHGPLARFWLGSVADELVRRMPIPVLITRPHDTPPGAPPEAAFRNILIPLDGSALAEQILEPAIALGTLWGAEYTLLRAVKPMVLGPYDPADGTVERLDPVILGQLQAFHEEEATAARAYLEAVAGRMRARGLRVQARAVVHEQPAAAILEHVKAHRPDLVAIETHGRSGLPRLFLGSVADKVLRGTTVPVLMHRPLTR
jgi:nucleotide-binding universal stress UspA family protein